MAYVHLTDGFDLTGARVDADGKMWMWARAGASATAQTGKVLGQRIYDGKGEWIATIPFDTGYGTETAAAYAQFYVGFPNALVPSDTHGWFQVGGEASIQLATEQAGTAGCYLRWEDATVQAGVATSAFASVGAVNYFGAFTNTNEATFNHANVCLFGRKVCGQT